MVEAKKLAYADPQQYDGSPRLVSLWRWYRRG